MSDGRHICFGFRGDEEGKVRNYSAFLCSMCGANAPAIELPEEGEDWGKPEGSVTDKRRFAHLLEEDTDK